MENGFWKKYAYEKCNIEGKDNSCVQLYNDLKDSNKKWPIVDNYEACCEVIKEGEDIGGEADVYVYYINENNHLNPILYFQIISFQENANIRFNGAKDWQFCENTFDSKYLPIVIEKIEEIGYSSKILEERNEEYQKALQLFQQKEVTQEDLVFLYKMAYVRKEAVVKSVMDKREIQYDFERLSFKNKIQLLENLSHNEKIKQLSIDSKEILIYLAKQQSLYQLDNATEDIIDDKKFVMNLIEQFLIAREESGVDNCELQNYFPEKYKTDIDFYELLFKYRPSYMDMLPEWKRNNSELEKKLHEPDFCYQLLTLYAKNKIQMGTSDIEAFALLAIPHEIRSQSMEDHVLIGPQPNEEKQKLKVKLLENMKNTVQELNRFGYK